MMFVSAHLFAISKCRADCTQRTTLTGFVWWSTTKVSSVRVTYIQVNQSRVTSFQDPLFTVDGKSRN